ncbi:ABC-type glycerol-3-phosphate transport system, substrate-binding protein [Paenibacillus sp. UNCCL117]|uniref:ABC transporter substrate-binding protein n=1 Tax=unclassified Paenibacillus TaxID=185978 RepID=UPI00088929A4|nr:MULTISPECIES: sugar ABC transporter substrate-binding protein [unclassified Paenibacillus]SDE19582.1 ABC-type glycerol-3-phosphate transport system, substrate-binding protein [Paenibacillus sp. cl123]SFW61979.1 ABC-type glycerol-3-phosphate transport system, substrate-binding protein [Paenibacillus sp. UNCCL117]
MTRNTKLVSAVLAVSLLAGCSGQGGDHQATDGKTNGSSGGDGQVTLTFWRNSGNDTENAAYDKLVASFMEKNPGIKVEMTPIPYSDYDTKLRVSISSGSPPDIMALDAPTLGSYAHAGALKPLTSYFKADGNMDDIPKSTLATYTYQNEIYMAPLTESSIALFYNKKLFEAKGIPLPSKNPDEPWTWEQVLDAAKKINDPAGGVFGIDPAQGFNNAGATAYFKYPIIWQFGGELMDAEGKTSKGYLDSPETKKALEFFADLYNKHSVSALEYPPDPFPNGKLGMTVDGSWSLAYLAEKFPNFKLGVDYDIAPLPKGSKQAVANGSWALGISAKSQHADAAWKFVNFVTSKEGQIAYSSMTKDIPSRYSAAKEFPELNEYPKNVFVVQNQKYGRPRPITPIFPQMSEAVNKLFEEIVIGKRNVDASVAEAVKKIDKAYADMDKQK